jgi:hypothetical protein
MCTCIAEISSRDRAIIASSNNEKFLKNVTPLIKEGALVVELSNFSILISINRKQKQFNCKIGTTLPYKYPIRTMYG